MIINFCCIVYIVIKFKRYYKYFLIIKVKKQQLYITLVILWTPHMGGPVAFSTAITTYRLLFGWCRKLFYLADQLSTPDHVGWGVIQSFTAWRRRRDRERLAYLVSCLAPWPSKSYHRNHEACKSPFNQSPPLPHCWSQWKHDQPRAYHKSRGNGATEKKGAQICTSIF